MKRLTFALLALAIAAPAHADTLVDNVNGITLDQDGKVVRFLGRQRRAGATWRRCGRGGRGG